MIQYKYDKVLGRMVYMDTPEDLDEDTAVNVLQAISKLSESTQDYILSRLYMMRQDSAPLDVDSSVSSDV